MWIIVHQQCLSQNNLVNHKMRELSPILGCKTNNQEQNLLSFKYAGSKLLHISCLNFLFYAK